MTPPAWFQENLGLKVISLILAFFLWAYVTGGGESERGFIARLEPVGLPTGLIMADKPVRLVDVRLAGPRLLLAKLAMADRLAIPLDLMGVGEGIVTFTSLETRLQLPAGVRVTRVFPSTVEYRLIKGDGAPATSGAK